LTVGFTAPSAGFNGTDGYPNVGYTYTPRVVISNSNNFGSVIGYITGTYPSTVTLLTNSSLGTLTPNLTPVNSLILLCNLVSNDVSSQGNLFTSIPISNTSFGSNINYNPSFQSWISVNPGSYSSFTITILDQNFNFIESKDPNMLLTLTMKVPDLPVFSPPPERKILSVSNLYN
jgi:hypothetical protein